MEMVEWTQGDQRWYLFNKSSGILDLGAIQTHILNDIHMLPDKILEQTSFFYGSAGAFPAKSGMGKGSEYGVWVQQICWCASRNLKTGI